MKKSESSNTEFFQAKLTSNKQISNSQFRKRIFHNTTNPLKQQNFQNNKTTEYNEKKKKEIMESRHQLIDVSFNQYIDETNSKLDFYLTSPESNNEYNNKFSSPRNFGRLNPKLPTESSIPKLTRFSTLNSIPRLGSFQDLDNNEFSNTTMSDDVSEYKSMPNSRMDSSPAIFMQEEKESSKIKMRLPPLLNARSSTMSLLPNIPETDEAKHDKFYSTSHLEHNEVLENKNQSQNTLKSTNFRVVTPKESQTRLNKLNESKLNFSRNMKINLSPSPNEDDAKNDIPSKVGTDKIKTVAQANSGVNQYLLKNGSQTTKSKGANLRLNQDFGSVQEIDMKEKLSPLNYTPALPVKKEFRLGKGNQTGFVNLNINEINSYIICK